MTAATKLSVDQKEQVRYWIHTIGCDIVACHSDTKDHFKECWGINLTEDIGVAIICGKLRHGPHKGKYISTLDFDTLEAFKILFK
jgi:hypothetical protein